MTDAPARLDRAAERRTDLAYLEAELARPDTLLLPLWRGQAFADERGLCYLRVGENAAAELIDRSRELVWLGLLAETSCFAVDLSPLPAPDASTALRGMIPSDIRALALRLTAAESEPALYAHALFNWHERSGFCGVCGHATKPRSGGHLRVCSNAACATQHFPRTDPCVLVLVCDGDRCLLGRSKGWPAGMYSALAGFVEPGESLEQAAAREVLEEVNIPIDSLRYVTSQAWPFPASLMMGFVARALARAIRVDEHELEAARWVTRAELAERATLGFFVPSRNALAGRMIEDFAAGEL
jgi:NAD+ diphosphatase